MRIRMWVIVSVLSMVACVAAAQSHRTSEFAGVWRGQFDNLPGVAMVITDEGGELRGGILFYLHRRPDLKSPYTSIPGLPEPMLALKADGQTLDFQVSHKRAHPPGSLHDTPVSFKLKLSGPGHAELINMNENDGPHVVMTRTDF